MPKVPITFTDELYEALKNEAERRNTTIAALIREYAKAGLAQSGVEITQKVQWGGNRRKPKGSEAEE
jgi:hypothetical protein